jgi:hypothetical protein
MPVNIQESSSHQEDRNLNGSLIRLTLESIPAQTVDHDLDGRAFIRIVEDVTMRDGTPDGSHLQKQRAVSVFAARACRGLFRGTLEQVRFEDAVTPA